MPTAKKKVLLAFVRDAIRTWIIDNIRGGEDKS